MMNDAISLNQELTRSLSLDQDVGDEGTIGSAGTTSVTAGGLGFTREEASTIPSYRSRRAMRARQHRGRLRA